MQIADPGTRLGDRLALDLQDQAQHAVRRRVLRTHVDDDPLLGTGADLADDVIPVPADGVEDALVGIRVGLGKGIAAGDLEVLVDSGEDRAVVAHQV